MVAAALAVEKPQNARLAADAAASVAAYVPHPFPAYSIAMTSQNRSSAEQMLLDGKGTTIARRQALRRIGLLGLTFAAPPTLLAACSGGRQPQTAPAGPDAYVDFSDKPDGDPPAALDTGQPVDYVQREWKPERKPQIRNGALVHGELPANGAFANYYQAQLGQSCHAFGTSWTLDSNDGSTTPGVMCLAAWAGVYASGTGMTVPRTPGHIVIDTMTGVWQWWISDGLGTASDHLKPVKSGRFEPPASDGRALWETAVHLDVERGIGRLYLPGNDVATGVRDVTLSDSEIGAALSRLALPATTFEATQAGADVVMVEHFAKESPATARYPRFLSMWATNRLDESSFSPVPG